MSDQKTKAEDAALGLAVLLGSFLGLTSFFGFVIISIIANFIPLHFFDQVPPTMTFHEKVAWAGCVFAATYVAWVVFRLVLTVRIQRFRPGHSRLE